MFIKIKIYFFPLWVALCWKLDSPPAKSLWAQTVEGIGQLGDLVLAARHQHELPTDMAKTSQFRWGPKPPRRKADYPLPKPTMVHNLFQHVLRILILQPHTTYLLPNALLLLHSLYVFTKSCKLLYTMSPYFSLPIWLKTIFVRYKIS